MPTDVDNVVKFGEQKKTIMTFKEIITVIDEVFEGPCIGDKFRFSDVDPSENVLQ